MEIVGIEMKDFYKNKVVLITGNTGFKGTWLTQILLDFQARVIGYALKPNTQPSLFEQIEQEKNITQIYADIRDYKKLKEVFDIYQPEVVFHLAAQPLVKDSYENPRETYEINVMGTVNILECCRHSTSVKSIINVTTDKVYRNNEWDWGYREVDLLDGFDPYSNSKSCSELVTASYVRSFFNGLHIPVSTMRAGNVIGGGDYAKDRIIPDAIRALNAKQSITIRNPLSIRPYQHVLEPLFAYLNIACQQALRPEVASNYNIGPNESDCVTTQQLIEFFNDSLENLHQEKIDVIIHQDNSAVHEAHYLRLDCSKYRTVFDWKPVWSTKDAIKLIVDFSIEEQIKVNLLEIMKLQISEYKERAHVK